MSLCLNHFKHAALGQVLSAREVAISLTNSVPNPSATVAVLSRAAFHSKWCFSNYSLLTPTSQLKTTNLTDLLEFISLFIFINLTVT